MNSIKYCFLFLLFSTIIYGQKQEIRDSILLDSIRLSDPFILADEKTETYYMTGSGGKMWKSKNLKYWAGPYNVVQHDTSSWMGKNPSIWAAELHQYKGKYYYFATFTNQNIIIDTVKGRPIHRRASHVLVSENPDGPYKSMKNETYLSAELSTLDGTLWVDQNDTPFMIFCHEWIQNLDGTMEKIELKKDLSGSIGKTKLLFRASDSPWSRDKIDGKTVPNMVTDGPFVFRTQTGKLGMLWTSWIHDIYTQGVAYSKSGTIDGPWIQEEEPITPPNFGHGMMFRTFNGELLMSLHSHRSGENGKNIRHPKLFNVDDSGDEIIVENSYFK